MKISEEAIQKIKNELWRYFQNQKAIKGQRTRLDKLEQQKKSILEDINSPQFNHSLQADVKGIDYDKIITIGGGPPSSTMERDIERIYKVLEKDYHDTVNEILQTKRLIRNMEEENSRMEFYLGMLSQENRRLLDLKYLERKSILQMTSMLNVSEATISRLLKDTYEALYRLKVYYEKT